MLRPANSADHPPTADVCLLLRAHAEARWLNRQVLEVVRELERDLPPADQLAAALAYVEALWIEACTRAAETDAARAELEAIGPDEDQALHGKARRYHAAVRRLRTAIGRRVERLISVPDRRHTRGTILDRYASS